MYVCIRRDFCLCFSCLLRILERNYMNIKKKTFFVFFLSLFPITASCREIGDISSSFEMTQI